MTTLMAPIVSLREVRDGDLEILFEHQADPVSSKMAAFPSRDRATFVEHWAKISADPTVTVRAVLADGVLAGNVDAFNLDGWRLVGYWYGRQWWGKGVATRALALFLEIERARPLRALVAQHNLGSVRVLEKNGFVREQARIGEPLGGGPPVPEYVMRLDG